MFTITVPLSQKRFLISTNLVKLGHMTDDFIILLHVNRNIPLFYSVD